MSGMLNAYPGVLSPNPVLPRTSPEPCRSLAVPLVTTSRIIGRSPSSIFGVIGVRSPVMVAGRKPSFSNFTV